VEVVVVTSPCTGSVGEPRRRLDVSHHGDRHDHRRQFDAGRLVLITFAKDRDFLIKLRELRSQCRHVPGQHKFILNRRSLDRVPPLHLDRTLADVLTAKRHDRRRDAAAEPQGVLEQAEEVVLHRVPSLPLSALLSTALYPTPTPRPSEGFWALRS